MNGFNDTFLRHQTAQLCRLARSIKYAHPRTTSNTTRIHQLGAILRSESLLEGVGEEEDVWEDDFFAEGN